MTRLTHAERAEVRRIHGLEDPRKTKKYFNDNFPNLYQAYLLGDGDGYYKQINRNPYPAGKRHDEYERGFQNADPMGDWHGRNE